MDILKGEADFLVPESKESFDFFFFRKMGKLHSIVNLMGDRAI